MVAPRSSAAQAAAKNAASKGGAGNAASANTGPKSSTAGRAPGASAAAAKASAAKATTPASKAPAKSATAGRVPGTSAAAAKSTALGKVAQAAKQNAQGSGTATRFGGAQFSPGKMYSNAARSSSALNSVLNNTRLAGMNNRQTVDAVARNMGLSNPIGRAGMIGTFDHESAGLNPRALGDQGTAFGLGQWRGDRRTALGNYAGAMGQNIANPGLQTAFGVTEMGRAFPGVMKTLQSAQSIPQAVAAMNTYERPRGYVRGGDPTNVAGWNDRVARSNNALSQFSAPPAGTQVASTPAALQGRDWNNVLNTPYNTVFQERAPVTGQALSFPGRPRNDGARLHAGLDFGVKPGSPVTPTVPGKVVQVAYSPGAYGPTVQVMNTYGGIDRYAMHEPQNIPVKVGQPVYPGTVLGTAGKLPGRPSNFSHLHYENITAKDPAHGAVVAGMQDGSLAKARGRVIGSTSTPAALGRANIQSSTPSWARSMGIDQGESVERGVAFRAPGQAAPIGSQVASVAPNAAAEAARIQRRDAALQTLAGELTPSAPRPQPRPADLRDPRRMAAETYTSPYDVAPPPRLGASQGPRQPGDPTAPRSIPAPQSTGMMPARTPSPPNMRGATSQISSMAPPANLPSVPGMRGASDIASSFPAGVQTPRPANMRGATDIAARFPAGVQSPMPSGFRGATQVAAGYPAGVPSPRPSGFRGATEVASGLPAGVQTPRPSSLRGATDMAAGFPSGVQTPRPSGFRGATEFAGNLTPFSSMPVAPQQQPKLVAGGQAWKAPPMGGALPSAIGDAFGVWGTTRNPPAAPHPGTPASQTAEVQTDTGGGWLDSLKQKVGEGIQVATEKQQELKDAVETYGEGAVLTKLQQMAGKAPASITSAQASNRPTDYIPSGGGTPYALSGGGGDSGGGQPLPSVQDLMAFQQALQQAGASPEDIAYVQQLIDMQTARA